MPLLETRFDVIIVGGRPAGATLAARLAQGGLRVLLLDRATFPSLPAVSSPIIYACTMALLDEIGADEAAYAHNTPKIRKLISETRDYYRAIAVIPEDRGRDYAYAIDRARFDNALWEQAAHTDGVTALPGFAVSDLLWDGERVIGVTGRRHGSHALENFHAETVVGADGRWSLVARKVNAPLYNVDDAPTTSLYYAYWRDVQPYDLDEPLMIAHGTLDGLGYLTMDSADGTTAVVCEAHTETIARFSQGAGEPEALYTALLQNAPRIWARLQGAERVTTVRGLKHTPNYYRQPFGAGWALVGDAVHHKDPLGGQGIYDAIFSAKAFAEQYLAYKRGTFGYITALSRYKEALEAETLPIYFNTLAARANLNPPNAFQRLLGRYLMESPEVSEVLARVPARMGSADTLMTTRRILLTVAKGVAWDARRTLTSEMSPSAVPPLPSERAQGVRETSSYQQRLGCLGWLFALPAIMMFNGLGALRRKG
ncbi:MAG: NAD(P)/FAD-dependent oxidoreductase [Chloroflexi bacterium CFX4]|nr:NAD(P)/FAD-dependent oxidoreductase [Chloroflexi bacterium CFX4]MDL1923527.1 NAD(P)/FAD-dependent oxidoreductase [Chloroflexi bacterium CFX3]